MSKPKKPRKSWYNRYYGSPFVIKTEDERPTPKWEVFEGEKVTWQMYLTDAKVYQKFGPTPERGKAMPWAYAKTASGIKFNAFKGSKLEGFEKTIEQYQKVPEVVPHRLTLVKIKNGLWECTCVKSVYEASMFWLQHNCTGSMSERNSYLPTKKKKRRASRGQQGVGKPARWQNKGII
jgi:hypothetical protein